MSAEIYAALAELAAQEHQLVIEGRYEELEELAARREPLIAALPENPPYEALAHIKEALRVQSLVTEALREARDAARDELAAARRTREGAKAYGAAPEQILGAPRRIDQAG
jgi:dihydrodipicolinate synthase/N-acetylneuraminate lyase